jgi:hypothetical protein
MDSKMFVIKQEMRFADRRQHTRGPEFSTLVLMRRFLPAK